MADRTVISKTTIPGGSVGVGFQEFVWAAADTTNFNRFASTGKEILLARNTDVSPHKVTRYKPAGKIEYTLGADDYLTTGQIPSSGWNQSGYVNVDADSDTIEFAVLMLP